MLFIDIITLFPVMFEGVKEVSMWRKAQEVGAVSINIWNVRDFSRSKQYKVDAPIFGHGPGMLFRPEPLFSAIEQVKSKSSWVVYPSASGKQFTYNDACRLCRKEHLIFVCGHYEGIDQRISDALIDEELSIGEYVLTGGEIATIVIIDSLIRFLPHVLGDENSLKEESYSNGLLEYPHYTRPEVFRNIRVPDVLLTGDHNKIDEWRKKKAIEKTLKNRPDLLEGKRRR